MLWFTGEALDYDEDDDEDDDDEGEEAELRAMLGGNLPDEDDEEVCWNPLIRSGCLHSG